jgi:hypothetical protein
MSQAPFESRAAIDAAPHKSILAAWAIALALLSAGELFVSFHARIERPVTNLAAISVQHTAVEDALVW